jgi:hypothetical protein
MLRFALIALLSMIVLVNALSVEVSIGGPKKNACKGVITFLSLDTDCGECLYGVKSFRYATVKCKTDAAAQQCCKTVAKTW